MIRQRSIRVAVTSALLLWGPIGIVASLAQEAPRYAGPTDKGFVLPNGWTLQPAGRHVPLADLPLNVIALADNRHALAATAGYNAHELSGVHDDDDGDLSNAPSGYLWDACARAGLSFRSYGEHGRRVSQADGSFKIDGAVPRGKSRVGETHQHYGIYWWVSPTLQRQASPRCAYGAGILRTKTLPPTAYFTPSDRRPPRCGGIAPSIA